MKYVKSWQYRQLDDTSFFSSHFAAVIIEESRHAPNPTMGLDFQKLLKVLPSSN